MVTFEALHEGVVTPTRATREAAGYDLSAFLRGRTVRAYRNGLQLDIATGDDSALVL